MLYLVKLVTRLARSRTRLVKARAKSLTILVLSIAYHMALSCDVNYDDSEVNYWMKGD